MNSPDETDQARNRTVQNENAQPQHKREMIPLVPRLLAILILLLVSGGLFLLRGADVYAWPAFSYIVINGIILLLGLPAVLYRAMRQTFGEGRLTTDLLMAVVIVCAAATGMLLEAALVVLIATVGEWLERTAHNKIGSVTQSFSIPGSQMVHVREGDDVVDMPLEKVQPGQTLVVNEGEIVPVDGAITFGNAQISEAAITGEASFNPKAEGDHVFAGSDVQHGFIEIQMQKRGEETLLAQVEQSVRKAARVRTDTEILVDRITSVLIPIILAAGLGVFLFYYLTAGEEVTQRIRHALPLAMTVVVVASPAALALAAPTAVWVGLRRAARRGILFRNGKVLEQLAGIRTLLIDKTGTLTVARPQVVDVRGFGGLSEQDVLEAALFVERHSNHPLAKTITEYGRDKVGETDKPEKFFEFEGGGACGVAGDRHIKVGAMWLMEDGRDIPDETLQWVETSKEQGRTCVLVADKTRMLGGLAFQDTMRPEAKSVMERLRKLGIRKMVMMTGDSSKAAHQIAVDLGMNEYVAECMPDTKLLRVKKEQGYGGGGVAMVGDGINDAPALAKADVGISMGAMGTDLAVAASQVTLLKDNLEALYDAFAISRRLVTSIGVNIFIACVLGLVLIVLAALGQINLLMGAILQQLIAAIIAINAGLFAR